MIKKHSLKNPLVWALVCFPLALTWVFALTYPFADTLDTKTFAISMLTPIQRSNIELAAKAVNGTILRPGEKFSFNHVVGPRTDVRGYRPAPSYLGPDSPSTTGGGICLLSSALYQLALESGLKVDERVAHMRTIRTVPAGMDATVWYGQADLSFVNTLPVPVQISADWNHRTFTVSLMGKRPKNFQTQKLERIVSQSTPRELVVELMRQQGNRWQMVSRDHYTVSN